MQDTMGIDQFGQTYHGLGKYPRKALMKKLGRSRASKMYVDKPDGRPAHVGYILAGLWIRLYTVTDWTGV